MMKAGWWAGLPGCGELPGPARIQAEGAASGSLGIEQTGEVAPGESSGWKVKDGVRNEEAGPGPPKAGQCVQFQRD